jgi:acetyl coenzyme A synthetase (ADP forming)-like protein
MESSLLPFFKPRGVVVIGASTIPEKLGYGAARNLVNSGYQGAIHFVSRRTGNLFGRPVYPDLDSTPDPIDLAVLIVPALDVPQALHACGRRGLRAVIIVSSGFRESGPAGAKLEAQCLQIAQQHGLRLIGPNCIGLLDTHLPLDTTFLPPPMPPAGEVAFISQSGAICAAIIDWARGQGFGFSRLVSLGNQADVNETDMLAAVVEDEHTRVLTLYLESVSDGRRFIEAAQQVTFRKPVVALKVGRFESGQRAAASHTGALAGSEAAYQAAFERAGVFRAETSEEMFDWATALAVCPLPKGRRMAVLTNAGGPGVIAADALETHRLSLAELSPATRKALTDLLPSAASLHNPVDMLASASPEVYAESLRLLLADPNVDGVLVILPPPPMYPAEAVAEALIPLIHASNKPVVVALMGEQLIQKAAVRLRAASVPEYRFPERAASSLAVLVQRAEFLAQPKRTLTPLVDIDQAAARQALSQASNTSWLEPQAAGRLMSAYGIPTAPARLARSSDEASRIAKELGFPLVVKVASPDISHKSELGAVLLGIDSSEAAAKAFRTVTEQASAAVPQARIAGALLQRQLPDGQEVIVGALRDTQFGGLMMFGSGGVEVEGLKDVTFSLAPLSKRDAELMLSRTWAGRKLAGYRSIPAGDARAVQEALTRLSWLVNDFPAIDEVEINPLRVMASGQGAIALDVRVKISGG